MPQENNTKLSIVIPIYNESTFIIKLFDQILNNFNSTNIEIFFIDDGSSDGTNEILSRLKTTKNYYFKFKIIKIDINSGKGKAIQIGIKKAKGEYILLQDADLELDIKDAKEMYEIICSNTEIKCIFGSRYLSGKLKKNNYFINSLVGKVNTLIFNIFFSQSISDVHCGLKILHKSVLKKINLTVNDFGIEIDLASQIVRNNFFIYEYGVSYYFRSKAQGKKITWVDGIKSFFYLLKARFYDNPRYTNISILYSSIYMAYVGSYFGMGLGNSLFIILFFLVGTVIGLNYKFFSSSIIFFSLFIGSLFGQGNGNTLSVLIFFIFGLILANYVKNYFSKSKFKIYF